MIGQFRQKEAQRHSTMNEVVNLVKNIGHLNTKSIAAMGTYFSQKHEDEQLMKAIISEYKSNPHL